MVTRTGEYRVGGSKQVQEHFMMLFSTAEATLRVVPVILEV